MKFRLRLFWRKTISGNDFTPHCVFGCTWKIKFSRKAFPLTVCFMALTRKMVHIFIFATKHFRVWRTKRERRDHLTHSSLTWYSPSSLTRTPLRSHIQAPARAPITPRTHRSTHRQDRATNWSTHLVSDPLLDWPTTFRSTHLVHQRVAPTNRSLSVPLSRLVLWFWFFLFWFLFLVLFIYFDSL